MTAAQLLRVLQDNPTKMNYEVVIGVNGRWVSLESVSFDLSLKTLDLGNMPPTEKDSEEEETSD